ncbi:MAG: polyprenyl synthetase family protein [Sedimentisphaerales bacterium]
MYKDVTSTIKTLRPPQDNIPQTKQQRNKLLQIVAEYIQQKQPVGPLSFEELRIHSEAILKIAKVNAKYRDFIAILINNEVWRDTIAGIPFEKRLLLLPKCLRSQACPASFDELGLVCEHCGRCVISGLKSQAEQLGYAVLIAEGSPVVMSLIETGKIEAVIGVSCLSVLQRVFPYIEAGAVPGIAIALLQDGCADTNVDVDWVWEAIDLRSDDLTSRLNLEDLRSQVNNWFSGGSLESLLGSVESQTEELALEWLSKTGKRWRPFLTVCTYKALAENSEAALPEYLRKTAVAVECFHKASLIHDDIEDGDRLRYGQMSLHAEYGVPMALNVGDFLLGEGYRLLTELDVPDTFRVRMLNTAAEGHHNLCLGQGSELSWLGKPRVLSTDEVIDIFRKKTSPAFEVALKLGAILAGHGDELGEVLKRYSESLGIAYQIHDDIDDFHRANPSTPAGTLNAVRPSLLLAMAYEMAANAEKKILKSVWDRSIEFDTVASDIQNIFAMLKVEQLAWDLMESYKSQAISSLTILNNSNLKGLLRRVVGKIFNDFEVMGCCNDYKVGHADRSQPSEKSVR